jgi:YgiT-type zinc finger domain-containing protein
MNDKFKIKTCPSCGSDNIKLVTKDVVRNYKGRTYTVPNVEFYECYNCGEKVYDRVAIQKIEAVSPAYQHKNAFAEA